MLTAGVGERVDPRDAAVLRMLRRFPGEFSSDEADALIRSLGVSDGEDLCQLVLDRKIVHVLVRTCRAASMSEDREHPLRTLRMFIEEMTKAHLGELALLAAAFADRGVEWAIPKGLLFAAALYRDGPLPFSGDVDLLVARDRLADAQAVLEEHGYRQGLVVRKATPVRLPEQTLERQRSSVWFHGQTPAYTRLSRVEHLDPYADFARRVLPFHVVVTSGDQVYLRPTFDLHYSLNTLCDDDGSGDRPGWQHWWPGRQTMTLLGTEFTALSDHTVSWFAPYHLYLDLKLFGDRSWKLLADLTAWVKAGRVDFDALSAQAQATPAVRPALYHVYRFLQRALDAPVPEDFLAAARIPSTALAADFGDLTPQLLRMKGEFELSFELSEVAS